MNKPFVFFLIIICVSYSAPFSSASTLALESNKTDLHVGDVFYVDVVLDTLSETINAVDVTVGFPSNLISFVKAEETNSFISLWIQKPLLRTPATVEFSGIAPGGRKGVDLQVIRLYFETKQEGQDLLVLEKSVLLLHDGTGTQGVVETSGIHIAITAGERLYTEVSYIDTEPPEPFTPVRVRDADIFDGAYFLVFETQDKNSGIAKYRVKEGFFGRYTDAVSPYRLQHQEDDMDVYIQAIDRADNKTVARLYPQSGYVSFGQVPVVFSILIVFISLCLLFFLYRRVRGKK